MKYSSSNPGSLYKVEWTRDGDKTGVLYSLSRSSGNVFVIGFSYDSVYLEGKGKEKRKNYSVEEVPIKLQNNCRAFLRGANLLYFAPNARISFYNPIKKAQKRGSQSLEETASQPLTVVKELRNPEYVELDILD